MYPVSGFTVPLLLIVIIGKNVGAGRADSGFAVAELISIIPAIAEAKSAKISESANAVLFVFSTVNPWGSSDS
jgi:hypothetical protein